MCYDSSNQRSLQPLETLLRKNFIVFYLSYYVILNMPVEGYRSLKVPTLALACKSDLERQIDPEEAVAILRPYDVGLVEVTTVDDMGKTKLQQSFHFLLKAIFRNRRSFSNNYMYKFLLTYSKQLMAKLVIMIWIT